MDTRNKILAEINELFDNVENLAEKHDFLKFNPEYANDFFYYGSLLSYLEEIYRMKIPDPFLSKFKKTFKKLLLLHETETEKIMKKLDNQLYNGFKTFKNAIRNS